MPLTDAEITQSLGDDLPVGIWVARAPGGEFVYANRAFREIMGMEARSDVAAGEYAAPYGICTRQGELYPESRMPFIRALEAGTTVIVDDIVIHRSDGGRVHIRAQARPVEHEGRISHVVIAFIDISREVEAEARLRLAQRMESIGKLAGGIAHDFNNLLSVVQLVASSLLARENDPFRREALTNIQQASESGAQLTRSLLDFARSSGRPMMSRVQLNDVVEGVEQIVRRTLGSRIVVELSLESRREVMGERSQLEQVVMNLVLNARDAMAAGGELSLRTRDEGDELVFEVADTGTGIPPELRQRIFEPYFTTRDGVGTGLGLATVFSIVQGHGGSVSAHDHSPRGTLMRVRLPAAPRD
jgi:two-component system cell cycle sensor histidine kinase/response regulator CckA